MTVLAWDGRTLAADRLAVKGGMRLTITKIEAFNGLRFGGAGSSERCREMAQWVKAGRDPLTMPAKQLDGDTNCDFLVIDESGQVLVYADSAVPCVLEMAFYAMGSGADYAMAAMHLGKTAAEAVLVASHFNTSCGNGFDAL